MTKENYIKIFIKKKENINKGREFNHDPLIIL